MNFDLRRHGVGRMNGSKLHGEPQGMLKLVQAKTFVRKFLDKVKDRLFKRAGRTTTDTSEASRGLKKVQKENNYCDLDSYPSYSSDEDYSLEDQKLAEDYSDVIEYLKKYNLLEGYDGIEDVLATDDNLRKRYPLLCLATISQQLTFNKYNQANFQTAVLDNLFMKHLVEHCSHSEIQEDQALIFHHAFPHLCLPESIAKKYYDRCAEYRHKELPQEFKDNLLREIEERQEQVEIEYRDKISYEVMRDIKEKTEEEMHWKLVASADPEGHFVLLLP